jgi:soluble lytic murein transglycosylase-like protein
MRGGVKPLAGAVTAVVLAALAGCGGSGDAAPAGAGAPTTAAGSSELVESPSAPDETPAPRMVAERFGPAPSPSRSVRPSPTARRPRPAPSRSPTTEKLPPPPPKPSPSSCVPKHVGYDATRAEVRDALEAAAGRTYWPNSAPEIKVPVKLVKAVAWQESGWQSDIVACDGGVGLMQVMPGTADYVNMRFDQNYDINDYRDNATLGANYLAWLIKYFGDVYFQGDYDLTVEDPDNPVLLDAVIAAYNVGPGAVDTADGLVIPNRTYVNNVEALMSSCVCLSY